MKHRKLVEDIREILIVSQYEVWVHPPIGDLTANDLKERKVLAMDYYSGVWIVNALPVDALKRNRFLNLINNQVSSIVQTVAIAQAEKETK